MSTRKNWTETTQRIYKEVPEIQKIDWTKVFNNDPTTLGHMINDIVKLAISEKGRPGKRSASSANDIKLDLAKLNGSDYAEVPFEEAMAYQMSMRSVRQVAATSGMSKSVIHRLSTGESEPTPQQLELLAKAFKKDPGYFVEYRAAFICSILYEMLTSNPDSSKVHYEKLKSV